MTNAEGKRSLPTSLVVAATILGAILLGVGIYSAYQASDGARHEDVIRVPAIRYTLASFDKLTIGMTYAQTVDSLQSAGAPIAQWPAGGRTLSRYGYYNADGSRMVLTFDHDRLVQKHQTGLR